MRLNMQSANAKEVSRLMSVALVDLYCPDSPDIRIDTYLKYQTRFLHHIVEAKIAPVNNSLQNELSSFAPRGRCLYLYIAAWAGSTPTHYVVLHRDSTDNLWRVTCRRVLNCKGTPNKDGILVQFPSRIPQDAAGLRPRLTRIFGGSLHIRTLAQEIAENTDLQWELHLSYLAHSLTSKNPEFSVWLNPGKSIFRATENSIESNPFISQKNFECIRTRAYAKNIHKPRCIIWADCPGDDQLFTEDTRHIVPQIKAATPVVFEAHLPAFSGLLDWGLPARLYPYIGIQDYNTRRVTVYGLSYNPERRESFTSIYAENKRLDTCSGIPLAMALPDGTYMPNYVLLEILKYHMLSQDIEDHAHLETLQVRWHGIRRVMASMSSAAYLHQYPIVFANWGFPFSSAEQDKLDTYAVFLGQRTASRSQ